MIKFDETEGAIEAILFAAGESVSIEKLSSAINCDIKTTRNLIYNLKDKLDANNRGVRIVEVENSFQICSQPKYSEFILRCLNIERKQKLSQTLIETLAIIAYMQPVAKVQIEEIRGVNADHAVNKLIEKNLVCEKGRLDAPGRPLLFGTTEEFIRYYDLSSVKDMPKIELDEDVLKTIFTNIENSYQPDNI